MPQRRNDQDIADSDSEISNHAFKIVRNILTALTS